MASNGKPHFSQNIFQTQTNSHFQTQTHGDVWQDKARISSARTGTRQPAPPHDPLRAHPLGKGTTRSKNKSTPKRKTVQLTLWIDPIVKAELQRLAEQEGLTISKTGAAFLKQALQQHVDLAYSALLEPIIKTTISKHIIGGFNRLAWLLVRIAFDADQTRAITTNVLGRQQGMTTDELNNILTMTQRAAKGNITRRSPELIELINAVENWLLSKHEEQDPSD